jgi:GH25 family lysozyme M1 (1,4-beta-N-acetylmuramidase)
VGVTQQPTTREAQGTYREERAEQFIVFLHHECTKDKLLNELMSADKAALFLVADVEEQTTDMAPATQAFIDTLKAKGWKGDLYSGHDTYKPLDMDKVKADFVWIPRYGSNKPACPCDLWQYTETGRLVSSNVDLNKLTGSKLLSYFTGGSLMYSKPLNR